MNNFYILITGKDTSESDKTAKKGSSEDEPQRLDFKFFLQLILRFIVALLPITAAFGMANLIYVLKYTGLVGFMCFLFPFSLQVRSIFMCQNEFSKYRQAVDSKVDGSSDPDDKDDETKATSLDDKEDDDKAPLTQKSKTSWTFSKHMFEGSEFYMTTYSRKVISRPISVIIVGVVGSILFVMAFSSLFLHPQRLDCEV